MQKGKVVNENRFHKEVYFFSYKKGDINCTRWKSQDKLEKSRKSRLNAIHAVLEDTQRNNALINLKCYVLTMLVQD